MASILGKLENVKIKFQMRNILWHFLGENIEMKKRVEKKFHVDIDNVLVGNQVCLMNNNIL